MNEYKTTAKITMYNDPICFRPTPPPPPPPDVFHISNI